MLLKISVLFVLSLGFVLSKEPSSHKCDSLNNKFGDLSHKFVQCVLEHNKIATFCLNCSMEYAQFLTSYNDLMTSKGATIDCRPLFIDNNQLDIVESVYAHTKHLWDSGFCSGEIIVQKLFFRAINQLNLMISIKCFNDCIKLLFSVRLLCGWLRFFQ